MDGGWRYLGGLARRLRWTIVGAILAGLAWQGAAIAAPLLIRSAVDAGIVHGDRGALWWACAGVIALGAVEAVSGAGRHYCAIRNRAKADADVRDGIFRRALELDARYHDRVGAGDLISRASNDAELVARVFDSIGHTTGYVLTIFGASTVGRTFDNAAGLNNLTLTTLSTLGVNGAFNSTANTTGAVVVLDIGSPGTIAAVPEPATLATLLGGLLAVGTLVRRRS